MKQLYYGLFTVLAAALMMTAGCSDDDTTPTPPAPISVKINYVAVRTTGAGQHQLGVEFESEAAATAVVYIDGQVAFSGAMSSFTKVREFTYETFINIADPGTATHKVYVEAADAASIKGTSEEKSFTKVMKNALVEIVTSANCAPCAPENEYFKEYTSGEVAKIRVVPIKYHVWWPKLEHDSLYLISKTWCKPRVQYLFSPVNPSSAPVGYVDGTQATEKAVTWLTQANINLVTAPAADIKLTGSITGSTLNLTIDVYGITTGSISDLRLHTVVTESNINYNDGNAEFTHYDVMKQMYPNQEGESVSIANGAAQQFQRSFDIASPFVKDNLHVVVFLQSNSSKAVLQAAKLNLK